MPRALLDTSMLFAAAYQHDDAHEIALPILQGVDDGKLPEGVVLDYVLAETLNGLGAHAGQNAAVDFLDRLEENERFHVETLARDTRATAKALFRQHGPLSFVDAAIVAYMRDDGLGYIYALDDDFDGPSEVYRLDTATNPYDPE